MESRKSLVALQVVTLCFAVATLVGVWSYRTGQSAGATAVRTQAPVQPLADLPRAWVLPDTSMTPAKDQQQRGTCWIFSTMGVVESSYRKNGYAKGFLKADEYVSFSEQAYGVGFTNYCMENKSKDPFCFAGPASGSPSDGEPEWLYYMGKKVTKYVLPHSVCPYYPDDAHEMVCDGLEEAVSSSPISFRVKSLQSAYTIDAIKRLLYEKQVALAWSHAVYETTYVIPCSDNNTGLWESEQCTKCLHPCTTSKDGCCAEMVLPGYTKQGVFGMHKWPHLSGGHAMLVVGWTDDYRVDTGLPGQMAEHTTGGLIIKNSWGHDMGHSANYWAQKHSLTDENFICPNEASSSTWIPANGACMLQKKDPLACANGLVKIVGKNWIKGATVLKCTARSHTDRAKLLGWTGCREGYNYVLVAGSENADEVKVTVPAESDGYVRFHLIEWNPNDTTAQASEVVTGASTWYGIENLLTPVSIIGNTDQCGYFLVPYQTFTEGNVRFPTEGHDTPVVSYIELEWDDKSYAAGRTADPYKQVLASTQKWKPAKFTGPFDWNADI